MKTLATKQTSNKNHSYQKPVRAVSKPIVRSLFPSLTMLQRKSGCVCGGGCPRCQEQALLQPKLKIGEPGDKYEQEADRIADEVMRMPEPAVQLQIEPEEEEIVQTKAIANQITPLTQIKESSEVPPIVHNVLQSPGQPLSPFTRFFMESRFERDFSQVRVHSDAYAAESASEVNSLAYTVGQNVVFGVGKFAPNTYQGKRLLAHELAHAVQQQGTTSRTTSPLFRIQRQEFFGPGAGAPSNWSERVEAAQTSAARTALVQYALGEAVVVVDRTNESQDDATPNSSHLVAFTSASPRVNYDDNLQSKRSPVDRRSLTINAGYTLHSNGNHYIVLSRAVLAPDNFLVTRITLNHELDHVRQALAGSTLHGNESELDAWTSTFIREFHRSYTLGVNGTVCYVQQIPKFAPLLSYFTRTDVSDTVRNSSVQRIVEYYNNTVRSHPGHRRVFHYWIHRTLKRLEAQSALAEHLNTDLTLGIDASVSLATTRQFDCAGVREATFPEPPTVELPSTSSDAGTESAVAPTNSRRFGLELRGGLSLPEDQRSAALSLGGRFSLRSERAIVINPLLGARLLYLPPSGDRATHLAAILGEAGLRIQQPLQGVYLDLRVGGYVGMELPSPEPAIEGGLSGSVGLGYRWERVELGAEVWRAIGIDSPDRFIVLGLGSVRF